MTETTADAPSRTREFTVTVNDQPVRLTEHRRDGAQIKAAAIADGVPIQQDFVLSLVLPGGKQEIIPDGKEIDVHQSEEFWAIPGDDNS
jgi:hypothetical protein